MTAPELLAHLRERGASIEVADGRLRVRLPKGVNTSDVREALAARKAELVALLSPVPVTTRQPGRDERGFPLDRYAKLDDPTLLTDVERRVVAMLTELRDRGVHPPWLAAERKSEVT